ncbi:hypothetical protein MTO96_028426 [Rhipicephalus appendiculatus]
MTEAIGRRSAGGREASRIFHARSSRAHPSVVLDRSAWLFADLRDLGSCDNVTGMHKTQMQFSAGDCITFGEEGEDEVPLTQAPGSQSEVAFQGGRRQARTQQRRRHRSRSAVQRLSEGRALSALRRRLRSARTTGAKLWPTLWFAQMSAIVVTLVVAALVALTFVLREAQLTAKEAQNAGRALDVDDIGNGTNITAALLFGDGAADLANSSLQEWSAAVVRGSAGSSFTGQSSTTRDGVPHLKERGA